MKILHVAEVVKGGIATFLNTFGTVCNQEAGVENRFVVPDEQADYLLPELATVTFARERRGLRAVSNLARVARSEAVTFRPDIIWFHSTFSFGAMAWLRVRRVPGHYVYTAHCWGQLRETGARRVLVTAAERQLSRLPDLIVNIAENDRAVALSSGYGRRHVVVENALPDLTTWPDAAPFETGADRLNLLFVGRFERQKGLDLLLAAFAGALGRNPRLHLHVVGSGSEGEDAAAGLPPGRITFHSWVPADQIAAYYRFADLVVMPSRWEGLPMVLIEALRAGTPVMLSEASGLPKLIEPGDSGLVMPLDPVGMEDALAALEKPSLAAMRGPARALYERRYSESRFRTEMLAALKAL
ncbi:Glycosyl transferase, group 1 family protein [Rhodovulum sp. P5]|uniref:glycosyltransferase family 4 protein n=1 Tax=Rhodovulum sp. P5 TaxID=1564506 RepID=UPI0009C393A7|nr:glycosyltransferase family 4 protein [Rhodovulum sp. P5]ARE39237.1 Glycosyl transferase, group 1 family protein [Rhodovulum sp. P5]